MQAGSACDPYKDTAVCGLQNAAAAALGCDASAHVWAVTSLCAAGAKCTTTTDLNGHAVPACSVVATNSGADAASGGDTIATTCSGADTTGCYDATHYRMCLSGKWSSPMACPSGFICVPTSGQGDIPCAEVLTPGMSCDPAMVLQGCGVVAGQEVRMTCDAASHVWIVLDVCADGKACAVSGLKASCAAK